jgi:hypothetical protein
MRRKSRRQLVEKSLQPQKDAAFSARTSDYSEIGEAFATKPKVS